MSDSANAATPHMMIELILARCLRIGSIVAAALLALGLGVMAATGAPVGKSLMTAGLIALLLTPVLRVLVAAIVFVKEKDWLYVAFCLVVLCSLAAGVKFGLVE
ncbi:DUF1634 domain-containing protein [Geothrix sp. 21YS21S-4]|uniref:DUF1634 domain-containing protein n=1 Tax=Geothrix sp. 21YS21S-4 TaxID=3068889 RepID=UPI0027B9E4AD|nr:DUF1634 domain-containing protein [Geothrix sp. 21YS21S-4]